jgi:hypothetical protein
MSSCSLCSGDNLNAMGGGRVRTAVSQGWMSSLSRPRPPRPEPRPPPLRPSSHCWQWLAAGHVDSNQQRRKMPHLWRSRIIRGKWITGLRQGLGGGARQERRSALRETVVHGGGVVRSAGALRGVVHGRWGRRGSPLVYRGSAPSDCVVSSEN